jgi:hypothetical protein
MYKIIMHHTGLRAVEGLRKTMLLILITVIWMYAS